MCGGEGWRCVQSFLGSDCESVILYQLDLQSAPQGGSGLFERRQCSRFTVCIEQSIYGCTAGVHTARHLRLSDLLFLHQAGNLKGQNAFSGHGFRLSESTFFCQKIIQGASQMLCVHHTSLIFHAVIEVGVWPVANPAVASSATS